MAEPRRFLDQSQPQTLQIATILLYLNAALGVLYGAIASPIGLLLVLAMGAGGFGIANEKRWGYTLAVAGAVANLGLPILVFGLDDVFKNVGLLLALLFDVALVALLLHPQSREYQRIWFS